MKKHKMGSFLTVGQLKEIIKNMADDAFVLSRDRDCISLDCVDVVNIPEMDNHHEDINFSNSIEEVYGGMIMS